MARLDKMYKFKMSSKLVPNSHFPTWPPDSRESPGLVTAALNRENQLDTNAFN
jgi:hypothetical protein